ncbi:hypothetical protein ACFYNO_17535 [Kitasatospora sp. NPDC006697]|uniref:hypothetical protein n=1 Tax=Kitasatospora sp. NPDC006697 TaxID=3364020 RepID=UPI0036A01EAA
MTARPRSRRRLGRAAAVLGTGLAGLALALTLATPDASSRPAPPGTPAARQHRPDPHIMDFAQGLAAHPMAARPQRAEQSPAAANADGCDHHYGALNVCVPAAFPPGTGSGTAARCAWLAQHGFTDLAVHGTDDLGLDPKHSGTACSSR